jgi:hypothetical protein
LAGSGIVVHESGSPEFVEALARLFDPGDIEKLRPILAFCLFIRNCTGRYLAGLTVVYEVPEVIMVTGKPYRITISMSSHLRNRQLMGEPGGLAFMSPVSATRATLNADGARGLEPALGETAGRMIQRFMDEYAMRRMNVSVDSIIDEDGLLEGPDEIDLFDKVNAKLKAYWDLTGGVAGLHGEQLAAALAPTSDVGLPASQEPHGWYGSSRRKWLECLARPSGARWRGAVHDGGSGKYVVS